MREKAALGWLASCILVVVALIVGCHGDGVAPDDGVAPPPVGTSTLTGLVFAANDLQQTFSGVPVSVAAAQRTVPTENDGTFTIQNLPAGTLTVEVLTPTYPDYGSTRVTVELVLGQETAVNLAVMPLDTPVPTNILLDPLAVTVDLFGKVVYRTQIVGEGNVAIEGMEPTWVVEGGIGAASADGVFTAQQIGAGTVTTFAGDAQRTGTVIVVAPRPPQINSLLLNPTTLPASGGDVYIATSISDGDGIPVINVRAEVFGPGDEIITVPMAVTNPGTALACADQANCYLEASYGGTFSAPPNDNQPTAEGIQAPENYSARIRAIDRAGGTTTSAFIDFVVQGIDQPPGGPTM